MKDKLFTIVGIVGKRMSGFWAPAAPVEERRKPRARRAEEWQGVLRKACKALIRLHKIPNAQVACRCCPVRACGPHTARPRSLLFIEKGWGKTLE
jgi:ribonuclease PH